MSTDEKNIVDTNGRLRWFVGVPIITNILIWSDMLFFSAILWLLVVSGILTIQVVLTRTLAGVLPAATGFATLLSACFLLLFICGALVIYRNRYIVLYSLDKNCVSCENMLKLGGPISESFHIRPFSVKAYYSARKSITKQICWADVSNIKILERLKIIALQGGGQRKHVLMRIYCPNDTIYERVFEAAKYAVAKSHTINGSVGRIEYE